MQKETNVNLGMYIEKLVHHQKMYLTFNIFLSKEVSHFEAK